MARKSKDAAPAFDFASLEAETVDTLPKGEHAKAVDSTPFPSWVQETYETDTAKAVTVPTEQVKATKALVRQAAARHALGARIRERDNGNGTVTVTFKGATKRARKSRQ